MNKRRIISIVATFVMLFGFNSVASAQESEWTYLSTATRGQQVGMFIHSANTANRAVVATCARKGVQMQLGTLSDASTSNQKALKKSVLNQTKNKDQVQIMVKRPNGKQMSMKFMKSRSAKLGCH